MPGQKLALGEAEHLWLARTLRQHAFFADMTLGQMELILPTFELVRVGEEEAVIAPGAEPAAIYLLYRGELSVRKKSWLFGRAREVARLKPGEFFGEMAILEGRKHRSLVVSVGESLLFVLAAPQFRYVLERNPALLERLRELSSARLAAERALGE